MKLKGASHSLQIFASESGTHSGELEFNGSSEKFDGTVGTASSEHSEGSLVDPMPSSSDSEMRDRWLSSSPALVLVSVAT
jgi:hypothetical protein